MSPQFRKFYRVFENDINNFPNIRFVSYSSDDETYKIVYNNNDLTIETMIKYCINFNLEYKNTNQLLIIYFNKNRKFEIEI